MTFGQDPVPAKAIPVITQEAAVEIFDLLKIRSLSSAREVNGSKYPLQFFYAVDEEFARLEKEFSSFMNGKLLKAEEATYDEEGVKTVTKEAVYYAPTTETDLLAQVSSDILVVKDVLNEIEPGGIWADYKALFNTTE